MAEIDCAGRSVREINAEIRSAIGVGDTSILVKNPAARHNLGVAILKPASVQFDGSVGYYCGGLMDGPSLEIAGSAGWGLAESMVSGTGGGRGGGGQPWRRRGATGGVDQRRTGAGDRQLRIHGRIHGPERDHHRVRRYRRS